MYICVCNAVTERHIEHAVRQGARRMRDLRQNLGVTSECNRCATCAKQCLNSALERSDAAQDNLAVRALQALTGGAPGFEPQAS
ncbi:MAG TPA: (2Fe-2S)-binding protein [Azoarcus taiwanensis]|nr:(2Fe-2S)-binding protein [Azoarcus taiwanensis]